MPFVWQITINKTAGGYAYEPAQLTQVAIGDQIIWTNRDDRPHWPGLKMAGGVQKTYFMPNQIAPNSPSDTFVPGVNGTVTYVDSLDLDSNAPTGTIAVG